MLGVASLPGDPAYPPRRGALPRSFPPLPIGRMGERAARAFNVLGWHWWPAAAAILTSPSGERGQCNLCGPCLIGCLTRAKASTDVTYLPAAIAQGVAVRSHASVVWIVIEAGRATGVIYRDVKGYEHEQPASVVVVACNGIGSARLLLASGI